jgi:hypothetical protein
MPEKFDETLTRPVESPADETKSPDCGGASSDACEGTASDLNPSKDFKSSPNLSPQGPVVKSNSFSLSDIRMDQDFDSRAAVTKVITRIPVERPSKKTFIRVHPEEDWSLEVWMLQLEEEGEIYIVHPDTVQYAEGLVEPTILYTAITRNGDIFLLPVKRPGPDGKSNSWHESRMHAAQLAKHRWVKIVANKPVSAYDIFEAKGNIPEPEWPSDMTFEDLLNIAFKDRIVKGHDHPVLRRLRGEI